MIAFHRIAALALATLLSLSSAIGQAEASLEAVAAPSTKADRVAVVATGEKLAARFVPFDSGTQNSPQLAGGRMVVTRLVD